jgi:two-component sensor histidine kinase
MALDATIGRELPFITYFPALIAAAALGGIEGGAICLLLSTAAAWILFLPGGAPPAWAIGSFWISGGLIIVMAAALADSVRELRRSRRHLRDTQARLETLVGELAHRNRNALAVATSIVSQSARAATSIAEAERIINERLVALARAQDVVLDSKGAFASLYGLLKATIAPFDTDRFIIARSRDAMIAPEIAGSLGLLLHEMATNAVKHGALSAPAGRVLINWALDDGMVCLSWREVGGPRVAPATRKGFGSRLMGAALKPYGGKVERRFDPDGVYCELHIPARPVEDAGDIPEEVEERALALADPASHSEGAPEVR